MIKTQRQLQRELRKKESKVNDRDLFLSSAYVEMLNRMQHGIVKNDNLGPVVMKDMGGQSLAFTDSKTTTINYSSDIVSGMPRTLKHLFFIGLELHENGHNLVTDFGLKIRAEEAVGNGTLYPIPKENPYYMETLQALADGKKKAPLTKIYHHLDNILEDGFVDRAIIALVPGYGECLQFVNDVGVLSIPTLEELRADRQDFEVLTDLIYYYCIHDKVLYDSENADVNDELLNAFENLCPTLNKAVYEANPMKRQKLINEVFCYIYHFIEEQAEKAKQQSQQSQESEGSGSNDDSNQSSDSPKNETQESSEKSEEEPENNDSNDESKENKKDGDNTSNSNGSEKPDNAETPDNSTDGNQNAPSETPEPKSLEQMLNEASNGMKDSERSQHDSKGSPSSETLNQVSQAIAEATGEQGNDSSSSTSSVSQQSGNGNPGISEEQLNALIKDVAMEQLAADQEKDIKQDLKEQAGVLAGVPIHSRYKAVIKRANYSTEAKREYDTVHNELDTIVRRFMKEFQKEIKERQLEDTLNGLYNGKRIDVPHVYREDKRIFSLKRLPEDVPDMAVGILIDCSGSMWGGKLEVAKKCAYITYMFCKQLEIPVFVIGHNASGPNIYLTSVADENSIDDGDKIRIFDLESDHCNRDGYALRYCLSKLEKSDAQDKLMLVISDGQPAHDGYGSIEGRKDCQSAVHDALKQGITTITAGLGSDAPQIKAVYQEGRNKKDCAAFLDISDIDKMPKAFVKIIKERIMNT